MALNGERIVLLGGSSGIGLAAAQTAARKGATVVLVRLVEPGSSRCGIHGPIRPKRSD
jgi:NAD(P)-dependent dehydrogenase (short-subunit alcohol dehydrogenase family)